MNDDAGLDAEAPGSSESVRGPDAEGTAAAAASRGGFRRWFGEYWNLLVGVGIFIFIFVCALCGIGKP